MSYYAFFRHGSAAPHHVFSGLRRASRVALLAGIWVFFTNTPICRADSSPPPKSPRPTVVRIESYENVLGWEKLPSADITLTALQSDTMAVPEKTRRITPALLAQWITLQKALTDLPDSVRRLAPTRRVVLFNGKGTTLQLEIDDWGALAAQHPSVAAAFTQAGIAPSDYVMLTEQFTRPLVLKRGREQESDMLDSARAKHVAIPPGWPFPLDTALEENFNVVGPAEAELAAAGFLIPLLPDSLSTTGPFLGQTVPTFTVEQWINPLDEHSVPGPLSLNDGHIYVVDFSSVGCVACIPTYPALAKISAKYADRGVRTMVMMAGSVQYAKPYIERHHITIPIAMAPAPNHDESWSPNHDLFKINGLPVLLIIDSHGIVRYWIPSIVGEERALVRGLSQGIETLLAEQSNSPPKSSSRP